MKNSILRLLAISLITNYFALNTCKAQSPQAIPYQAIARNAGGSAIVSTAVRVRFSIRDSIATGPLRYQETYNPTTSALGLFSVNVGMGTVVSGSFSGINWGKNAKFLQVELDPVGGTAYTDLGTTQMMTVPYAMHSNSANTAITASNGVPAGGTSGQVLTNCNGVAVWTTGGVCPGTISALNCASATNSGTLTAGTSASGVSSSVPYTGGAGGTYTAQTINSTGVTGLTATRAAGTLASGPGTVTYNITGTPASSGTASFAISVGGQSCTLTRTVLPIGTITALNCIGATASGTLTSGTAASGVSSSVPYTGGNGGTYTAQSLSSSGVTGLTATLAAGTLLSGAGSVTFSITGTPASSGTASFALSLGGQTCTLARMVSGSGSSPLNIETSLIPAGTFMMGSPSTDPDRGANEFQHLVTLSAFRIGKYEISNAQYAVFLNSKGIGSNGLYLAGANPSEPLILDCGTYNGLSWTGSQWQPAIGKENFPVVCVTWYGAVEFATYAGGRLPTEAEWEYACRAGTTTAFSTGACLNNTQANYLWIYPSTGCVNTSATYPNLTQAVNSYSPNAWGLFNMHGNVWEWCADWYDASYPYPITEQTNPTGPESGVFRVLRGGCLNTGSSLCRSAYRYGYFMDYRGSDCGFRVAFAP